MRLPYPAECSLVSLAPPLLWRSPPALHHFGLGCRVFAVQVPEKPCKMIPGSSPGLRLPFRGCPSTEPLHGTLVSQKLRRPVELCACCSASHEVSPPSAFSQLEAAAQNGRVCMPFRLRLQVFSTSWRFHPPRACRPCFMPDPLLGLPSRALFLPRSRALSPAPLPSWRSVRLQGLAPRESPPLESAV